MLWYKAWLETRWRVAIGLVLVMLSVCGTVLYYPQVMKLMPLAGTIEVSGELGRRIREGMELARDYRGYVWSQLFRQNLPQFVTLFAVMLASGSPLSRGSEGAVLFTLSLPVSRGRLLGVRAAMGLAELLTIALVPALLVPLLSPGVGETYGVGSALIHGTCLFIAATVFFSLTFLLSTVFTDIWRPLLLTCAVAVVLALADLLVRDLSRYSIFGVMSGEAYFRGSGVPWLGLAATAAVSAALLYAAIRNIARQDF